VRKELLEKRVLQRIRVPFVIAIIFITAASGTPVADDPSDIFKTDADVSGMDSAPSQIEIIPR
jgi:hypothetical protein